MARIRTIKPEFWTDGDLLTVSRDARLFYIGLWNFSDDNGVIEYTPLAIKAKIFPADNIDIVPLVMELSKIKKVVVYDVNGRGYLHCKNLVVHQVIDRPRKSNLPLPRKDQQISVDFSPGKEGNGKEGNEGKEGDAGQDPASPPCESPKNLFDLWNKTTFGSAMPQAKELNGDRTAKARVRLRERTLEQWRAIFELMKATPFLNGDNDRGWRATFDWIIANASNSTKVLEGKYDSKGGRNGGSGYAKPRPEEQRILD